MFFHSWYDIGRVVVVATILFVLIVVVLRLVGQQTLAKMSGYDVVVTVTLGSLVSAVTLTQSITVSEAVVALLTLVALQEGTRRLQSRWLPFHHLVRESPRVVLWDGQLLEERLKQTSVSADEVRAAVRKMGLSSLSEVRVVVLENDGVWSVIPKSTKTSDESAFLGLPIPGRGGNDPIGMGESVAAPDTRLP